MGNPWSVYDLLLDKIHSQSVVEEVIIGLTWTLCRAEGNGQLVFMGPTTPWLPEMAGFGVDYLAGVGITDPVALRDTVAEGGGTRIFETGVRYGVADLRKAGQWRLRV